MHKFRVGLLATVVLGALTVGAPAGGAQETRCTGTYPVRISPGFGQEPSSGVFHSGGETGTITCDDGRSGTIGVDGRYGVADPDSCTKGLDGWGVQSITLRDEHIKNTATFQGGGLENKFFSGTFDGERLSGSYTFTPTEGDCVTAPVTNGDLKFDAVLRG